MPQGRYGRAENLVPTGIRSRTVQPHSSVAIPTELPGPLYFAINLINLRASTYRHKHRVQYAFSRQFSKISKHRNKEFLCITHTVERNYISLVKAYHHI